MLRMSKLADYAMAVMNFLAVYPDQLWSASQLAERVHLAAPTVSKVLKSLHEAELLTSVRGAEGGYRLARPAVSINLAEVLAAIDGKPALTECCQSVHFCSQDPICAIKDNWKIVNHLVLSALESLSLADMTKSLHLHPVMQFFKNFKNIKN